MADVIEDILADHRRFEELIRQLRDVTVDRPAVLGELSGLLVAHAEAEESSFYPALADVGVSDDHDVEHGEREHSTINVALLAVLELVDGGLEGEERVAEGETFDDKVEELSEALSHHVNEEEQTLLNDARTGLDDETRDRLATELADIKRRHLDARCGSLDNVRAVVDADGLKKLTLEELRELASAQSLDGRSSMTKDELVSALAAADG